MKHLSRILKDSEVLDGMGVEHDDAENVWRLVRDDNNGGREGLVFTVTGAIISKDLPPIMSRGTQWIHAEDNEVQYYRGVMNGGKKRQTYGLSIMHKSPKDPHIHINEEGFFFFSKVDDGWNKQHKADEKDRNMSLLFMATQTFPNLTLVARLPMWPCMGGIVSDVYNSRGKVICGTFVGVFGTKWTFGGNRIRCVLHISGAVEDGSRLAQNCVDTVVL
ncbi:hypothetical protein IW261DRAFT_1420842 [Armillaria novae-zelandiae]|uniref:Uncharacterized protein n=1 Tax=Armillaria novae-zelandiae TaxID=153914 RepID=A0AA39P5Z5_9AGAR|nr:hypothetical protein IW261DRAFT_1420842 [Armillaria novae-zelandiae]